METALLQTPLGIAKLQGDAHGLSKLSILEGTQALSTTIPEVLEDAVYQFREYFEHKRTTFSLKLHPIGTPFQQQVWQLLQDIPYGKTCSYMDIAKQLGDTKAIRAAATANGKNPLWIVIPYHRIIGSNGTLTGYAGGLWRKK